MRAACLLALTLSPCLAHAGNDDGVLLGGDASMTGGAVTAVAGDGAAASYNPAGLARLERSPVDVNGQAFVLRVGLAPGLLRAASGTTADGGYVEITSIPSALTLVRNLGSGVIGGFHLFVPRLGDHTDRVTLDEPLADGVTRWQLLESQKSSEYRAGLTFGFRVLDNLRVGVGFSILYDQFYTNFGFFGGRYAIDGRVIDAAGLSGAGSVQSLGGLISAGVQWAPIPELHIGLSVISPALSFGYNYSGSLAAVAATEGGPIDFEASDFGGLEPQVELVLPMRVRLGVAYVWDGGWVSIDGDLQHPIDRPEAGIVRELVFGVRLGTRIRVDDKVALGFGLFTDRSPNRAPQQYGESRIDFYGGTFGVDIRSPHRLGEGESASEIVFATHVSLRYALGVGTMAGLLFDTNAPDPAQPYLLETIVNEIGLQLGSALYF